jgi:TctA family transporter
MAEETLRQTLAISRGSLAIFVERGVSLTILLLMVAVVVAAVVVRISRMRAITTASAASKG